MDKKRTCGECPWWTDLGNECNLHKSLSVDKESIVEQETECSARRAFRVLRDEYKAERYRNKAYEEMLAHTDNPKEKP